MPLFTATLLPPLITLLNSASHPALSPLWTRVSTDRELPEDSFVCVLRDDDDDDAHGEERKWRDVESGWEAEPREHFQEQERATKAIVPRHDTPPGRLFEPVIHIQSPTLRTTFIQAGASAGAAAKSRGVGGTEDQPLGITLPILGMQMRTLGGREVAFEVGVVDSRGVEGRVRGESWRAVRDSIECSESPSSEVRPSDYAAGNDDRDPTHCLPKAAF
ncbi:hypothetical protein QFC19_001310 [Naganishia cerealis]|uniref:Uncharacterized protein n=1 Tax=Naganishia cerealis TaxID=610337 RepID=A0ACC2WI80_9TREE|nr:hypothetical protein QFC19_001310 [Naganishia cerealis]